MRMYPQVTVRSAHYVPEITLRKNEGEIPLVWLHHSWGPDEARSGLGIADQILQEQHWMGVPVTDRRGTKSLDRWFHRSCAHPPTPGYEPSRPWRIK
jgi:hypothetical protein